MVTGTDFSSTKLGIIFHASLKFSKAICKFHRSKTCVRQTKCNQMHNGIDACGPVERSGTARKQRIALCSSHFKALMAYLEMRLPTGVYNIYKKYKI